MPHTKFTSVVASAGATYLYLRIHLDDDLDWKRSLAHFLCDRSIPPRQLTTLRGRNLLMCLFCTWTWAEHTNVRHRLDWNLGASIGQIRWSVIAETKRRCRDSIYQT